MKRIFFLLLFPFTSIFSIGQPFERYKELENLIQADTITLNGDFADCGEWGGHTENIQIFKKDTVLWARFYKDTVYCDRDPNNVRKKIVEKIKIMSKSDITILLQYFKDFNTVLSSKKYHYGHACNRFTISSKKEVLLLHDHTMSWKGFAILIKRIFP